MTGQDKNEQAEQGAEEEPEVYAVQKDLTGWRFSRREFLAATGTAAAALALPAAAWGDAVGMPPTDCPDGTHGEASHCGEHCDATPCSSDRDCDEGESCAFRDLCVEEITDIRGWLRERLRTPT